MTIDWRVWYGDGTTYSSVDGPISHTPALDVQVIAIADDNVGRFMLSRYDFYWWRHGRWYGSDIFGLWDHLTRPGWSKVLFGRSIPNDQFNEAFTRALNDPDLPAKSAWDDREARP